MRFTLSWLLDFLQTDASINQVADRLNEIGVEVEKIIDNSAVYAPFRIAYIKEAVQHPGADKLRVCQVDTGTETLQIVCGAPNARAGIKVVLAPIGAIIPTNGMEIKAAKIRNVDSSGMMCSARELGLGNDDAGIIEVDDSIAIGASFAESFGLNDPVLEVSITPNRGDLLGVYGIARDLAASGLGNLKPLPNVDWQPTLVSPIKISSDTEACPYFTGIYIKDVKNAQSPSWLKSRLEAIGINPKSLLIDITNYMCHGFGRPMHAYDAAKITGNLKISESQGREKFQALDDKEYELQAGMVVISDNQNIQCLGGVIGGKLSGVSDSTTSILLETAYFDANSIASTGRKLQIITDSRYRLERKTDPEMIEYCAKYAAKLIQELAGGEIAEIEVAGQSPHKPRVINFDLSKIKKLIGLEVPSVEVTTILTKLGCEVADKAGKLEITIPSFRPDIEGEADIIEEIVRIHGINKVPFIQFPFDGKLKSKSLEPMQKRFYTAKRVLTTAGLDQLVNFSFIGEKNHIDFAPHDQNFIRLQNPISSDLGVMRKSLLPSFLGVVAQNNNRGLKNLGFFEIGRVFNGVGPSEQPYNISAIRSGMMITKTPQTTERAVNVYDIKADLFELISALDFDAEKLQFSTENLPSHYHPARAACLKLGKNIIAYFGELNPITLKKFDIDQTTVAFELNIENLPVGRSKNGYKGELKMSIYQAVSRDFAFLISKNLAWGDIARAVNNIDKNLIKQTSMFDEYSGKNIADDKKSIAFNVVIQADDRTLSEQEIENLSGKIVSAVAGLGGELRK